jgi:putative acetyltransferase
MQIRPEVPSDHDAIRQINIDAFAIHAYSSQTEHLIVESLRAANALSVSLVAEIEGNLVGHIAFSHAEINGSDCGWFLLGPVAVFPNFQKQGIGSALVNEGLKTIRNMGAKGCVLVGDPAFYRRFGFQNNCSLQMEGVPSEFVLALPMSDPMLQGTVTHHPAFSVGLEKDV